MKPATPLPFCAGTSGSHGLNKILDAKGHVVGEASSYSVHCFEQRDYLIHTANAYPQLVAALRKCIALDDSATGPIGNARNLLRKLGEIE